MSQPRRVTINHERVNVLSVHERLDRTGLQDLQKQLDLLLDRGARFNVADLSEAVRSDSRLFDLIARTGELPGHRDGWLRLVGADGALVEGRGSGSAAWSDAEAS